MEPNLLNRYPVPFSKKSIGQSIAIALISFAIIVVVFFFWTNPSAGCKLRGGKWYHRVDIEYPASWVEPGGVCVYIHADAGKPCKTNDDCQGYCMGKGRGVCSHDSIADESRNGTRIDFFGEWEYAP
jgi:hypothetical protein